MAPEVQKYDTKDSKNGYAGILGVPITALMVKDDKYAVAISEGGGEIFQVAITIRIKNL